jgi:hypothetical protein
MSGTAGGRGAVVRFPAARADRGLNAGKLSECEVMRIYPRLCLRLLRIL